MSRLLLSCRLVWLLALLALLACSRPALAQPEFSAWRFGDRAGLQFPVPAGGLPMGGPGRPQDAIEGCASVADSTGSLLLFTNAEQVYNRVGQPLLGGQLGNWGSNSVQGVVLLKHPGYTRRYVLLKLDQAQNLFAKGLRYAEIELLPDGSNGHLLQSAPVRLTPVGYQATEAMTAVRHLNGTDYWVVVHGNLSREFLSYRLSAAGLDTVPVRSVVGAFHGFTNPGVSMRASPDGRQLAVSVPPGGGLELFDFDRGTGRLGNVRSLPGVPGGYSLEYSPDGNLLYISGGVLLQADLRSSAAPLQLWAGSTRTGTVQRGPDGRLYVAMYQARAIGVITAPNVVGAGCGFQPAGIDLQGYQCLFGLPNHPNLPSRPTRIVAAPTVCAGTSLTFSAEGPLTDGATASWNFDDPAAGAANLATGSPVSHRYARPGRYRATLTLTGTAVGTVYRTWLVQVLAAPTVRLRPAPDTTLCTGTAVRLRASPQPAGTQFRWSDGSTDSTLLVQQPGRYGLEVRNAVGCPARDSVQVTAADCAAAIPNILLASGYPVNQRLVLAGLVAADWRIAIYNRWGREVYRREGYDNSWAAEGQAAGIYYYLLTNRQTGYRRKGWVEVVK